MIETELLFGTTKLYLLEVKVKNRVCVNPYLHFHFFVTSIFPKKYRSSKEFKFLGYLAKEDLKEKEISKYAPKAKPKGYVYYLKGKLFCETAIESLLSKAESEKIDLTKKYMVLVKNE